MEGERGEFNDWEVLQNTDAGVLVNSSDSTERSFDGIDGDSEGIIRSDYFSLHNQGTLAARAFGGEEDSVESDNPSWIDPAIPDTRTMIPGDLWSDSASDRSEDRKSGDLDPNKDLSFLENSAKNSQVEGSGEIQTLSDKKPGEFWSNTGGDSDGAKSAEEESGGGGGGGGLAEVGEAEGSVAKTSGSEGEKRSVLWWKVPMEVVKYCAFRVSPVWTFSVAAAVLGMVMLGRRLYKMKRKTQSMQLKVTMDDKKVSQFMVRVARLNEAFSVVKRVPVVRPALPAPGNIVPWPVMSLR